METQVAGYPQQRDFGACTDGLNVRWGGGAYKAEIEGEWWKTIIG